MLMRQREEVLDTFFSSSRFILNGTKAFETVGMQPTMCLIFQSTNRALFKDKTSAKHRYLSRQFIDEATESVSQSKKPFTSHLREDTVEKDFKLNK